MTRGWLENCLESSHTPAASASGSRIVKHPFGVITPGHFRPRNAHCAALSTVTLAKQDKGVLFVKRGMFGRDSGDVPGVNRPLNVQLLAILVYI